MTIFQVILKIIQHFGMMETPERIQLTTDVKGWEEEAMAEDADSKDKIKAMYGKAHKGVYVRLFLPFAFFLGVKLLKDMISDDDEGFLDND